MYFLVDRILTHWFSVMLLKLRYAFREAKNYTVIGKYSTVNEILKCYHIYTY